MSSVLEGISTIEININRLQYQFKKNSNPKHISYFHRHDGKSYLGNNKHKHHFYLYPTHMNLYSIDDFKVAEAEWEKQSFIQPNHDSFININLKRRKEENKISIDDKKTMFNTDILNPYNSSKNIKLILVVIFISLLIYTFTILDTSYFIYKDMILPSGHFDL